MSTMKQVCDELNMTYETLRFYCEEGLVPDVHRDKHNYRIFEKHHIEWLKGLLCLRKCGMSIQDMKVYMELCKVGVSSISKRNEMLNKVQQNLLKKKEEIEQSLCYIDEKQTFYKDVVEGKVAYKSNLKNCASDS